MHLVMLPVKTGLKQGKLMPRSHHTSVRRCNISTLNLHKLLPQHCVSQLKQDAMLKQRGKQSQNSLAVLWKGGSKRTFPKMHKGEFGICGVSSWKLLRRGGKALVNAILRVEKTIAVTLPGCSGKEAWLAEAMTFDMGIPRSQGPERLWPLRLHQGASRASGFAWGCLEAMPRPCRGRLHR